MSCQNNFDTRRGLFGLCGLAVIDFPVAFGVESHLEQAVFGIVTLAATRAYKIAAPGGALVVVVFSDRESRPATARDEEHAQMLVLAWFFLHRNQRYK